MEPSSVVDEERFSRWMSYVLRHNPSRYGLGMDRHGFVDLREFLRIASRRYPGLTEEHLRELIDRQPTQRFEVSHDRLRARYGHTVEVEPPGDPVEPPETLYHGTEASRVTQILTEGLQPMDRRFLHLSETREDALSVARRKTDQPVLLRIFAQRAHAIGIPFYLESKVYLTSGIPSEFLAIEELPPELPPAGRPLG